MAIICNICWLLILFEKLKDKYKKKSGCYLRNYVWNVVELSTCYKNWTLIFKKELKNQ